MICRRGVAIHDVRQGQRELPFSLARAFLQEAGSIVLTETIGIPAPWGSITLKLCQGEVRGIELWPEGLREEWRLVSSAGAIAALLDQLQCYLEQPRMTFGLAPRPTGTPFQQRVWEALVAIPPGRVETYGGLARRLGSGPRAVAAACRANPFPIMIPCHRVVAAKGLGGYCGHTDGPWLEMKRWLLTHEGYLPIRVR